MKFTNRLGDSKSSPLGVGTYLAKFGVSSVFRLGCRGGSSKMLRHILYSEETCSKACAISRFLGAIHSPSVSVCLYLFLFYFFSLLSHSLSISICLSIHARISLLRNVFAQVLLKEAIRRIRYRFNDEFDGVFFSKQQEILKIQEKNKRLRKILLDLEDDPDRVYEPKLAPEETPEILLDVTDEEVDCRRCRI